MSLRKVWLLTITENTVYTTIAKNDDNQIFFMIRSLVYHQWQLYSHEYVVLSDVCVQSSTILLQTVPPDLVASGLPHGAERVGTLLGHHHRVSGH